MHIAMTTKEPVRHIAPWQLDTTGAPKAGASVFYLRAGDVIERARFEADLAGEHASAAVWPYELREAALAGLRTLLAEAPEFLDRALEVATAAHAGTLEEGADRELWAQLEAELRAARGHYHALAAQAERRVQMLPLLAAIRYVVGWENVPAASGDGLAEFAAGPDGRVTLEALGNVPQMLLQSAGHRAYELQYVPSSDPLSLRSKSAAARATSSSGAKIRGGGRGRSPGAPGAKIRASS